MTQETGFDPENFAPQQSKGGLPAEAANLPEGAKQFIRQYVPADDDAGCIVTFEWVDEYKPAKSRECGREVIEPTLYIRKNVRGNNLLEVHKPASDADKRQFPYSWQEFQKGEKARERGAPLAKLGLDAPLIRAFQAKNVFTIEDLAAVSDNNLQHLGLGSREMRARAQEYVTTHAAASAATHEVDALRETVSAQSAQLAQALAAIERLSEENKKLTQRRKPGPKPKAPATGQEG